MGKPSPPSSFPTKVESTIGPGGIGEMRSKSGVIATMRGDLDQPSGATGARGARNRRQLSQPSRKNDHDMVGAPELEPGIRWSRDNPRLKTISDLVVALLL